MTSINENINADTTSINIIDSLNNAQNDLRTIQNNLNQIENKNIIYYFKIICISIFLFINFPIIFCDLYFAVNDNTCINQKMDKLNVNMYDYLIVSGIYSSIISIISVLFILFFIDTIKNNKIKIVNYLFMLFLYVNGFFNIAWNIIGSLIFWSYMDNSQCSNQVFNYLFASLIIKLIFSSTIFVNNNKNN